MISDCIPIRDLVSGATPRSHPKSAEIPQPFTVRLDESPDRGPRCLTLPHIPAFSDRTSSGWTIPGARKRLGFKSLWHYRFPRLDSSARLGFAPISLANDLGLSAPGDAVPVWGRHTEEPKRAAIDAGDDFVLKLYLRDLEALSPSCRIEKASRGDQAIFDDATRERLVCNHLHRVIRMALDFRGLGVPLCDLVNEGNIGLMRAAELFDPGRNVQFGHYAKVWIRMQMKRALSYQAGSVSLPADFSWRRGQVLGTQERLTTALKREPTETELAGACGLELPAVRRIRSSLAPKFVTFDSPEPGKETGLTLAEVIADETVPTPDQAAVRQSDHEFIECLLSALTPCQQQVIRLRFGLDDGCGRTLEEVARILGYVRQGIHRLETVALAKLRQHARFLQTQRTS